MSLTSTRATEYIDHVCPHADCGFHVTVPNVTDVYVCPSCESLVLVQAQKRGIGAGTNLRGPV